MYCRVSWQAADRTTAKLKEAIQVKNTIKKHKRNSVNQWVAQFKAHQAGQLEHADSKVNYRIEAILNSMTADQLSVCLSLMALGNSEGWRQAREQRRNLLVGYETKTRERRQSFQVIEGGSA